jgi:hypothetical protein
MRYTIQTTNLSLAAALAAVGIEFDKVPFTKSKSFRGGDQFTFFFKERSICGAYDTKELLAAWDDDKWHIKNPEHPFAYIKCAFSNRERLLDKVNQASPLVVIEKGGKLAIISANASEAFQEKIFSQL